VQYKVSETITAGQLLMLDDDSTFVGPGEVEVLDAVTGALNGLGCAIDTATYTVTKAADMVEGLVRVTQHPFAVWEFKVSGAVTAGTALVAATTTPSNILSNDTASTVGTLITDTAVGTIQHAGGLIKGRTGANAGVTRKPTSQSNSTSVTVIVPFPNTIAVNDTFIWVPYSRQTIVLSPCSTGSTDGSVPTYAEANGILGTDTDGIEVNTVKVDIDEMRDVAYVQVCLRTHLFNSLA
jgi:hypothetical protein